MRNRSDKVSHPLVQNDLHTYSLFKQVTFSLIKIITFIYTAQIQLCSFQMRQRLLENVLFRNFCLITNQRSYIAYKLSCRPLLSPNLEHYAGQVNISLIITSGTEPYISICLGCPSATNLISAATSL